MKNRLIVGIHASLEALKVRPSAVRVVQLKQGWEGSGELKAIAELAQRARISIKTVSPTALDKISRSHQGVYLEVQGGPEFPWQSVGDQKSSLLLALDGLEDPQNLGAIMRSAWLLGAAGILISDARTVSLTATVSKIACGGAEHVPVEVVSNLVASLKTLKDKGFWVMGLAGDGRQKLLQMEIPGPIVWVVGGEEKGLRSPTRSVCDEFVSIDQVDSTASLNASVACAIALAETRRQWAKPK